MDKPGVNIRYNAPQPTDVRWDSPLQDQAQTWLIGEEGEGDATYPVDWVLNPEEKPEGKPIRVRNAEAPPFGEWRQVDGVARSVRLGAGRRDRHRGDRSARPIWNRSPLIRV